MRAVAGLGFLLVALAVLAFVARTQLRPGTRPGAADVAAAASAPAAGDARAIEGKARADVSRALQEGERRREDAER